MSYEPVRMASHETLVLRGLKHHVSRWGPESDDPIVMLHGWADTADTFQFLADAFERDWPLAAFDWRGFGRTEWASGGYWFPDYFADLDAMLAVLCPRRPARLIGHSMGGNVALAYAGIRPDRVRAVVDLEGKRPSVRLYVPGSVRRLVNRHDTDELVRTLRQADPGIGDRFISDGGRHPDDEPFVIPGGAGGLCR